MYSLWAREVAQQLTALAALAGHAGSVSSTQITSHNGRHFQFLEIQCLSLTNIG